MTPLCIVFVVIGLLYLPLPLFALFRATQVEKGADLARWIAVILIFPVIGALVYLLVFGREPAKS
jgi:hypothetical protein